MKLCTDIGDLVAHLRSVQRLPEYRAISDHYGAAATQP